ncbi:overexpressed in colon carcinoma 1 protein isoform X2 [Etheostoma cragini]|uniref:overexpressed in colon carcinoma 1 protein isoform X2 n=1 Tax=Etheostoma cragini TaxID=417921 RepID=UPI00155EC7C7|nr:overexpressed in colon carcinoma 1 protein isoform X2 [Etheostoma cragini]
MCVCVCVCVSLCIKAFLSMLSFQSQCKTEERGGGHDQRKSLCYSGRHFFDLLPHFLPPFPNVFWVSVLSSSSSSSSVFFFFLSISVLLGRWLHQCKMGCGNSSATSTSEGPAEVSKDVTEDPLGDDEKRRNYGGVYVGLPADLTTVAASQSKSTCKD